MTLTDKNNPSLIYKNFSESTTDYQVDIKKRKTILKKIFNQISQLQNEIIEENVKSYGLDAAEIYFSEIIPVLYNIKYNLANLDKWSTLTEIENNKTIGNQSFSIFSPVGTIHISIQGQLPFYFTLTILISAISAGNKCVIYLDNYSKETGSIIEKIIRSALPENNVLIIFENQELVEIAKYIKCNYYFVYGNTNFYNKLNVEKNNHSKIGFYNIDNYKSFAIIDETFNNLNNLSNIFLNSFFYNGSLYDKNSVFFIHNDKIESVRKQILLLNKTVFQIDSKEKKRTSIKPAYPINNVEIFDKIKQFLISIQKNNNLKILMGGGYENEFNTVEPTIIETNLYSSFWEQKMSGPIIFLIPYYNIIDVIKVLEKEKKINKLYLFSNNKNNINFLNTYINSEQYLINETFIDRYSVSNLQPDNDTFYKGYTGFANFSNQKTIIIKNSRNIFEKIYSKQVSPILKKWFNLNFFKPL